MHNGIKVNNVIRFHLIGLENYPKLEIKAMWSALSCTLHHILHSTHAPCKYLMGTSQPNSLASDASIKVWWCNLSACWSDTSSDGNCSKSAGVQKSSLRFALSLSPLHFLSPSWSWQHQKCFNRTLMAFWRDFSKPWVWNLYPADGSWHVLLFSSSSTHTCVISMTTFCSLALYLCVSVHRIVGMLISMLDTK